MDTWEERRRKLEGNFKEGGEEHDRLTKVIEEHAGDEWGRKSVRGKKK
jgi:hypothetical protein